MILLSLIIVADIPGELNNYAMDDRVLWNGITWLVTSDNRVSIVLVDES